MNIWRFAGLLEPYKALLGVLLGVATVLAAVGLTISSNILITQAGYQPGIETVGGLVVLVRFLGISRALLRYMERLVSHEVTFKALSKLRQLMFLRLEPLSAIQIHGSRNGDTLTRFQTDVESLQMAWLRGVSPVLVAGLVSSLTVLVSSTISVAVAGVAALGFVLAGVMLPAWTRRQSRSANARVIALRSDYAARLHDDLEGKLELYLMGASKYSQQRLETIEQALHQQQQQLGRITAYASASAQALAWMTSLGVLWLALDSAVPIGLLAALVFGTLASFEAILPLGTAFATLEQSDLAAARLNSLLQQKPLVSDLGKKPLHQTTLRFENIGFAYTQNAILENLNFTLQTGTWTAILGTSGAGKTTLIRLAMRFLEPSQGRVLLGDTDIKDISLETLRNNIALVSQTGHVFNASLAANLRIAKPDATDQELWAVLEQVKLNHTVQALSMQLETPLEDNASQLSGGERQRLLIARALLRQTPILLLDEPTANLDADTQAQLMQTLRKVTHNKAVLFVTHRLETLRPEDKRIDLNG